MENITIEKVTAELHKAFQIFNKHYFKDDLPLPAITIQSSGHKRQSMGWCSRVPVWGDKEGKSVMYELNLSAEFLDLDYFETMDTLLHEMIHLYHMHNDIQDCSRKGTYHNKHFKNKALELGFEYQSDKPDKLHGWTYARLSQKAKDQIDKFDINKEVFTIARRGAYYFQRLNEGQTAEELNSDTDESNSSSSPATPPSTYKWTCPDCELIMRSTKKEVNVICGDCNTKLINVTLQPL